MMNPEKQYKLCSLFTNGLRFQKEKRNRLDALPKTVSPGELFLFPVDVAAKWCATFTHSKDDDLWYIVPGDEFPEVGTQDVALPVFSDEGSLNFRCGNGIWVHVDDFGFDQRVGQIDGQFVEQIRDHLGRIVKNNLPTVESLIQTDSDPDYIEWMEELSAAVQEFEQILLDNESKAKPATQVRSILPRSLFREHSREELGGLISSVPDSLAAESKSDYTTESSGEKPLSAEVPFQTEGRVFAIRYEGGVVIQAFGFNDSPPAIHVGDTGAEPIEWHQESEWYSSSIIPFEKNEVVLSIEQHSYVIEKLA